MQCTYVGSFDKEHHSNKRRRLIGCSKERVIRSMDQGISSETFREREVNRLMRIGELSYFYTG